MFKPQPMYVSRAVARAYGTEHPIDDPFGGPAYGEFNKSGSIGGALGGIASILGGAAMMMVPGMQGIGGMVIAGAMMAGGAMTTVGALSGNQSLMKIGGITSAVAGVAGLGYSAYQNWDSISNFFSSSSAATDATGAVTNATGAAYDASAGGGAALNNINAPSVAGQMSTAPTQAAFQGGAYNTDQLASTFGNEIQATQGPVAQSLKANLNPSNMVADLRMPNTATDVFSSGFKGLEAPTSSVGSVGLPNATNTTGGYNFLTQGAPAGSLTGADVSNLANVVSKAPASTGLLSSVGSFIKQNPVVSLMGLNTVAGMVEGASPMSQAQGELIQAEMALKQAEANYINSGKSKEAEDAFNRAKAYEEEKRQRYNESITNMKQADTSNLYQSMYPGAPNPSGIINQARA